MSKRLKSALTLKLLAKIRRFFASQHGHGVAYRAGKSDTPPEKRARGKCSAVVKCASFRIVGTKIRMGISMVRSVMRFDAFWGCETELFAPDGPSAFST
jgi:hypothetical protein